MNYSEFKGLSSVAGILISIVVIPILNFIFRPLILSFPSENLWIVYSLSIEWVLTFIILPIMYLR